MHLSINHTNTARGYVCSDHNRALAGLEFVQNPVTFVLLLVTVNSYNKVSGISTLLLPKLTKCRPTILAQKACNFVSNSFCTSENENLAVLALIHNAL